jgi:pyrroline-5-carboxylate reductase
MNICFIGGGNMATAMIAGMLKRGFAAGRMHVVELNAENRRHLHNEYSVLALPDMTSGVGGSEVVVLAVKPQQLREVAQELGPLLTGQLVISVAAGIRAADLARWLGTRNVVRAMPNTPALIRKGVTGVYALPEVSEEARHDAQTILAAVGGTLWLDDEAMMDAVTAVSGSGPAYVFYFIEALQEAGQALGLKAEDARYLAMQTFLGASRLADSSHEEPSQLRARVTSKNGTTERALLSMEEHQVKALIKQAVRAAADRAAEMGDELGQD